VDTSSFDFPAAGNVRPAELQMAEQLVGTLAGDFKPEQYSDTYRENLMRIINAKMKGKKIEVEEPEEPEPTNVVDLMARLQESLTQGKKRRKKPAAEEVEAEEPPPAAAPTPRAKKKRKTA
jgi:DNA end-binding protein Ku